MEKKVGGINPRQWVHIGFSIALFLVILLFNAINNAAVVSAIFTVASYTYGPLLGLYAFGLLLKKRTVRDKLVPIVCLVAPAACYALNANSKLLLNGYIFDTELILINGLLTFAGLLLISKRSKETISF